MTDRSARVVPLKYLTHIVSGSTPTPNDENWGGELPFVTPPDLNGLDGSTISEWGRSLTVHGAARSAVVNQAVILSCRAPIGHIGVAVQDVAFNQGCKALLPEDPRDLRYLAYALVEGRTALEALGRGTTFTELSTTQLSAFSVPWPIPAHREAIADYLDRETGEIDSMIGKLNELAASLELRRLSTIQRQTQFQSTGERWDVVPTAHLFGSIGSGTTPKDQHYYTEAEDGIPWVTTSELREGEITATKQNVTEKAVESLSSLKVHPRGAVLIAMYGATIGRLGVLGVDAAMNQACCAFSYPQAVDATFFYYSLWGQRDDIIREAVGGGQPNINQGMLRRWRVPYPPLDEQKRIADRLDETTGKIDAMLAKVAELKALLIERRAALITDVVTGRKDVA